MEGRLEVRSGKMGKSFASHMYVYCLVHDLSQLVYLLREWSRSIPRPSLIVRRTSTRCQKALLMKSACLRKNDEHTSLANRYRTCTTLTHACHYNMLITTFSFFSISLQSTKKSKTPR